MIFLYLYLFITNVVAFLTMYRDKQKARKNEWRTSEKNLWTIAVIGGSVGMWLGMNYFRHKTKHTSFRIGIPILVIIQMGLVLLTLQKLS